MTKIVLKFEFYSLMERYIILVINYKDSYPQKAFLSFKIGMFLGSKQHPAEFWDQVEWIESDLHNI